MHRGDQVRKNAGLCRGYTYLAEIIRAVPYWPRERYLELAPKYWARTRARLDADELANPIGRVTVPLSPLAEEQSSSR